MKLFFRILGNLVWWLFGGLEAAFGYFTGSLVLAITIIGIPVALQTFKIVSVRRKPLRYTSKGGGC